MGFAFAFVFGLIFPSYRVAAIAALVVALAFAFVGAYGEAPAAGILVLLLAGIGASLRKAFQPTEKEKQSKLDREMAKIRDDISKRTT